MGDGFLEEFERSVESDLQKLGGELFKKTNTFVSLCSEKHGSSLDDYVACRKMRETFLRKEMNDLSLRIKFVKYQTEKCCESKGANGIVECSKDFKVKLNQYYNLTF